MKFPFPTWILDTDIIVYKSILNTDGEPIEEMFYEGKAQFVQKTKQVLNARRELVILSGWLVIPGDIYLPDIVLDTTLYAGVNGLTRRVFSVNKPVNPDKSIYSTELFLI